MKINKFTIIIPTYNREETIYYTLKTCIELDYPNFEIIVSDGFSTDKTKEVIESFKDSRIKYYNTGKVVNMAQNWEFGLSKVEETDFVTYLGDDDGILKDSLSIINSIINTYNVECVTWEKIEYHWPEHIVESYRNYLSIGLNRFHRIIKAKNIAQKAADLIVPYNHLPCLYNSAVSYKLITNIKKICNGHFFYGTSPDVYSSFAIVNFVGNYVLSNRPFTINGASKHSNGTGQFNPQKKLSENTDVLDFYKKIEKFFNYRLLVCPVYTFAIADSIFHAYDQLQKYCIFKPNIKRFIRLAIEESCRMDKERFELNLNTIKQIGIQNNLENYTEKLILKANWNFFKHNLEFGLFNNKISFHSEMFGIKNVYDAAKFSENFLKNILPQKYIFRNEFRKILREIKTIFFTYRD